MKLGSPSSRPLFRMYAVRRDTVPCLRVHEERRHEPLAFGEVLERPEVDVRVALALERRDDHEPDDRHRDEAADHRAEAERRGLEETCCAGSARPAALGRRGLAAFADRRASASRGHLDGPLGLDRLRARGGTPASRRAPRGSRRRSRSPAPIGAMTIGLTISPTRMHATPAAKPIGYSDGPGRCGRSPCWGSVTAPALCGSPLDSIPALFGVSTT